MAFVTITSIWIDRCVLAIAFINGSFLFVILSKQLYRISKNRNLNTHAKIMHIFALFAIFISTLFNATRIPVSFAIIPSNIMNCSKQSLMMVIIWAAAKVTLYLFCTARYPIFCIYVYTVSNHSNAFYL